MAGVGDLKRICTDAFFAAGAVQDSCGHGSMKRWTEKKLTERSKWMDEWLDRQKDRQFNR